MGEEGEEHQLSTVPIDPRFPNTNQSRYCYVMFADYNRCIRLFNKEHDDCKYFENVYKRICPSFWIEKWESQLDDGTFPSSLPKAK